MFSIVVSGRIVIGAEIQHTSITQTQPREFAGGISSLIDWTGETLLAAGRADIHKRNLTLHPGRTGVKCEV